jgi:hypothetical protein
LEQYLRSNKSDKTFDSGLAQKLRLSVAEANRLSGELMLETLNILQALHLEHKSQTELEERMKQFVSKAKQTGLLDEGLFHGCIYNEGKDAKIDIPDWDREWGKYHMYDDAGRFCQAFDRYKKIYLSF